MKTNKATAFLKLIAVGGFALSPNHQKYNFNWLEKNMNN